MTIILGIETSCDETAAAVVADGTTILSSIVSSQIETHHHYGGVVPELASRKHIQNIVPVVFEAVRHGGVPLQQIDGIAVTQGPGLVGALLVGFCFAKSLAFALNVPAVGVNHLQGHLCSLFLGSSPPPFPFVSLLVSGGHTNIYYVTSYTTAELMGQTRDDAAGEAFDKVAKMLDLGYPGGKIIETLAEKGDSQQIAFPRIFLDKSAFDFSFSGLKTAVLRYIQSCKKSYKDHIPHIVAGFQEAVIDVLVYKLIRAALQKDCRSLAIVGGVAANRRLRARIRQEAGLQNMTVYMPSFELCGDNAAMIGAIGYHLLKKGERLTLESDVFSRAAQKNPLT